MALLHAGPNGAHRRMFRDGTVGEGLSKRRFVSLVVPVPAISDEVDQEVALEAGAEDFKADDDGFEILTDPAHFEPVHRALDQKGLKCEVAEVTSLPTVTVPLNDAGATAAVSKLIDALEDHDDVKEVYSNAEFANTAQQQS